MPPRNVSRDSRLGLMDRHHERLDDQGCSDVVLQQHQAQHQGAPEYPDGYPVDIVGEREGLQARIEGVGGLDPGRVVGEDFHVTAPWAG